MAARDRQYLAMQKREADQAKIERLEITVKQLTVAASEARVAREIDAMKMRELTAKLEKMKHTQEVAKHLEERLKETEEELNQQRIQNDSLQNELRAARDSNIRLTEMISNSSEFAIVSKLAKPGKTEFPIRQGTEDIRYLKGSGGIGKKDLKTAINKAAEHHPGDTKTSNLRRFHWTYKFWDKLSVMGRIEEEDMLWCPERAVEIVKDYDKGKFSNNSELAIEKLLFEVIPF